MVGGGVGWTGHFMQCLAARTLFHHTALDLVASLALGFFSVPRSYFIHLFLCIGYSESRPFSVRLGNLEVMELYRDIASSFLFARGIAECSGILVSTSDHFALEKFKVFK